MLLRIFFTFGTENHFFIRLRIIFRGISNSLFGLQYIAGLANEGARLEYLYDGSNSRFLTLNF